jgi:hypothetical protein
MGMAQCQQASCTREAVLKTDLFDLRGRHRSVYADKGQYPGTLDTLVADGYIRKIPVDPFTNAADTWQTIPSGPIPTIRLRRQIFTTSKADLNRPPSTAAKYAGGKSPTATSFQIRRLFITKTQPRRISSCRVTLRRDIRINPRRSWSRKGKDYDRRHGDPARMNAKTANPGTTTGRLPAGPLSSSLSR